MIQSSGRTYLLGGMREKTQNIKPTGGPQPLDLSLKRRQILSPLGWNGSLGLGVGRYLPVNTAVLSEFPSTPDTCICPEESIRDMPLSPSNCGVNKNLTTDDHNEVVSRSRRVSRPSSVISAARSYYGYWPIFERWAASGKKRG